MEKVFICQDDRATLAMLTGTTQNQVTILQGTVFTLKTSPEVSKSRVFRLSTETLNECRAWFQAFENVDGVVMQVNCEICGRRTRGRGREVRREEKELLALNPCSQTAGHGQRFEGCCAP